jgi:hypothetical protein
MMKAGQKCPAFLIINSDEEHVIQQAFHKRKKGAPSPLSH